MNDRLLISILFTILWAGGLPFPAFSQPGSPDTTFGIGGKLTTSIGSLGDWGNAVALQSDGKIVVGGYTQTSFTSSDLAVVRYLANGDPDLTFGIDGKVTTYIEQRSQGNAIALQNDGKIVLAGASNWHINLARYNGDGSPDTSFGSGGIVITDVEGYYSEQSKDIAILGDGKILIGGYGQHFSNDNPYFMLVRYHSDGSLDSTFGTNGCVIGNTGEAWSMAIQTDGKILLAGRRSFAFAVERYTSDGMLDPSFGVNGTVITPVAASSEGRSVSIQSDGKILVAGAASVGFNSSDFALVRYNSNGTPDNTFGQGGIVTTSVGSYSHGNAALVRDDGKILLAGYSRDSLDRARFVLARYTAGGNPDNMFGTGGNTITPFGSSHSVPNALAIQSDGRIVLAGHVYDSNNVDIALARYHGDETNGLNGASHNALIEILYPNPSAGSFTIRLNKALQDGELSIYAADGLLVHTDRISGEELHVSGRALAQGTYYLRLSENGIVIAAEKLVIGKE